MSTVTQPDTISTGPGCGVYFIQNASNNEVMDMQRAFEALKEGQYLVIPKIPVYLKPQHRLSDIGVPQQLWVATRASNDLDVATNLGEQRTYWHFENTSICAYLRNTDDPKFLYCRDIGDEPSREWIVTPSGNEQYPGTYTLQNRETKRFAAAERTPSGVRYPGTIVVGVDTTIQVASMDPLMLWRFLPAVCRCDEEPAPFVPPPPVRV